MWNTKSVIASAILIVLENQTLKDLTAILYVGVDGLRCMWRAPAPADCLWLGWLQHTELGKATKALAFVFFDSFFLRGFCPFLLVGDDFFSH